MKECSPEYFEKQQRHHENVSLLDGFWHGRYYRSQRVVPTPIDKLWEKAMLERLKQTMKEGLKMDENQTLVVSTTEEQQANDII